jgi:Tripartite tricarboxylate transporter family receptor
LGVSQNESVHPELESQLNSAENPESQQALGRDHMKLPRRTSCVWPPPRPRCRPFRIWFGRKAFRRDRYASWSAFRPAARPTSSRACLVSGCRNVSASHSSSRTERAPQGQIATESVIRAPADGHTLLLVVPGNGIAHVLYDKLSFNFIRDTAPVAGISNGPLVMEVSSATPVYTVPEFIAYAKARPGKVNFASPGTGSTIQLCGELFKIMTGVNMVHVPYRGNAPARPI